jgi:hypothetical protein
VASRAIRVPVAKRLGCQAAEKKRPEPPLQALGRGVADARTPAAEPPIDEATRADVGARGSPMALKSAHPSDIQLSRIRASCSLIDPFLKQNIDARTSKRLFKRAACRIASGERSSGVHFRRTRPNRFSSDSHGSVSIGAGAESWLRSLQRETSALILTVSQAGRTIALT